MNNTEVMPLIWERKKKHSITLVHDRIFLAKKLSGIFFGERNLILGHGVGAAQGLGRDYRLYLIFFLIYSRFGTHKVSGKEKKY